MIMQLVYVVQNTTQGQFLSGLKLVLNSKFSFETGCKFRLTLSQQNRKQVRQETSNESQKHVLVFFPV